MRVGILDYAKEKRLGVDAPLVITGGGTGGHLYPALAVAESARGLATDLPILFIGREAERDRQEVERRNIPFYGFRLEGLRRRWSWSNFRALGRAVSAWLRCLLILRRYPRGVVFGVGGYVSAPAMMAGMALGWRVALHEQNALPGLVNRWMAPWCDVVYLTYSASKAWLKGSPCEVVGFPIRREMLEERKRGKHGGDAWRYSVLVIGGSQGAKRLVETSLRAFEDLENSGIAFKALVQTGPNNYEWAQTLSPPPSVELTPFIENMAEVYRDADLIVSRAGSGSLSEIALWGAPAILVPYPFASEDHQRVNAETFVEAGAAVLITEDELTPETLKHAVHELLSDDIQRAAMAQRMSRLAKDDAGERIAQELIQMGVTRFPR